MSEGYGLQSLHRVYCIVCMLTSYYTTHNKFLKLSPYITQYKLSGLQWFMHDSHKHTVILFFFHITVTVKLCLIKAYKNYFINSWGIISTKGNQKHWSANKTFFHVQRYRYVILMLFNMLISKMFFIFMPQVNILHNSKFLFPVRAI
jgi:hypothetical protein